MKKTLLIISAVITLLLVTSCNQDTIDASGNIGYNQTRADDNPIEIDWSALDTTYFVSDKDVEAYIHFKKLVAESEKKEFGATEVVPLGLNDEATLAYLINYNEGWEIIAADKRAPMVLASGDEGHFDLNEVPENTMAWIESLEADVLHVRTSLDRPQWADKDIWDNMLSSIDFWMSINADAEYINRNGLNTRIVIDPIPTDPDPPVFNDGHWELISTTYVREEVSNTGHLTTTSWHQEEPYNKYMPLRTDENSNAYAGCSAVACAQMLFYLHKHYGYPSSMPDSVECQGNVNNEHFTEHGTSTTKWNNMYEDNEFYWIGSGAAKDSASVLIASCGYRLGLNYKNNGGHLTDIDNIRTDLFSSYGITCQKNAYDTDVVTASLQQQKPVVASACSGVVRIIGMPVSYSNGHVFLIDGYRKMRNKYTNVYEFIFDEPGPLPQIPIYREEITYSTPYVYQYTMNWGFNYNLSYYQTLPVYWYSMTGDWNPQGDNFLYDRTIFTGFTNNN